MGLERLRAMTILGDKLSATTLQNGQSCQSPQRIGITLVETLIAIVIFLIVCGGVFYLLRGAQSTQELSTARATASKEAEISVRQLERDIVSAKKGTFSYSTTSIQLKKPVGNNIISVNYSFSPPNLEREENGQSAILTNHLKELKISEGTTAGSVTATGTYILELTTLVLAKGSGSPQEHKQTILVVIKEESDAVKDPRFRPSTDVVNNY
ncbi:MAG: hypothetical protein HQM08_17170 [Candidatus Riflebacteria bacterium]|nr:hypothetical protein [Candidatus Riflebacteria bacterium]